MILIISNPEGDGHIASVEAELTRRGAEYRIFDPATYPESSTVTLESTPSGVRGSLGWGGYNLDLAQVKSVWYRRPGNFELSHQLHEEEDKWIRSECNHLFNATWQGVRSRWVSNPLAIRQASVKITQLKVAVEMGLTVPRFTVTNDPNVAESFISSCDDGAIVKVLANPTISYGQRACRFYTHLISKSDLSDLPSVRFGPTFLQEFIQKEMDVRVTVFGEEVFAVGIKSNFLEDSKVDFRRAEVYDLPHVILELPKGLASLCIALVRRLGLSFGAIDLVLTPDGRYIFLEINPNGQWYWLEWVTGVPLTKSLCDLLTA